MSNNPLQLTKLKICNLTKFEPPTVIPYSICVNFWVSVRKTKYYCVWNKRAP